MRAFILDSDYQELISSDKPFTMTCIRRHTGVGRFHLDNYVEIEITRCSKPESADNGNELLGNKLKTEEVF